jgi:hypothetical protein
MKTYGEMDVKIHAFLISVLAGGEWSASRLGRFTPGERALGNHWVDWMVPRTGLDDVERRKTLSLSEPELRPLGHPVCSHSLYPLRYPGSCIQDRRHNFKNILNVLY